MKIMRTNLTVVVARDRLRTESKLKLPLKVAVFFFFLVLFDICAKHMPADDIF